MSSPPVQPIPLNPSFMITGASAKHDPIKAIARGVSTVYAPHPTSALVIVIDDCGTEWYQKYGLSKYCTDPDFKYAKTPFFDWVADNGVLMADMSAEPVCSPTRVTINTGLYLDRTKVGTIMRDPFTALSPDYLACGAGFAIDNALNFLPRNLRAFDSTIATGSFGKWHMCDAWSAQVAADSTGKAVSAPDVNLTDPLRFGYQKRAGNFANVGGNYSWWKDTDGVVTSVVGDNTTATYPTSVNVADATAWLAARTTRFFAYIAFGPPHDPFTVPPFSLVSAETQAELTAAGLTAGQTFTGASYETLNFPLAWRAATEATDTAIGQIWASIPARIRAYTTLIITDDNGTVANAIPPGFIHQKREVFWGGTRAPCAIMGPSVARPGRTVKQIAHVTDIYATVHDVMGVPITHACDGVSLVPALQDAVDREDKNALRPAVFVQSFRPMGAAPGAYVAGQRQRAAWDGRFRYTNLAGVEGLYDNLTDPLEATNVIASFPDDADRLRALLLAAIPV